MTTAKNIAEDLYNFFQSKGILRNACNFSANTHGNFTPSSSSVHNYNEIEELGFANIAVQSVAYEDVPTVQGKDTAIYLYISKGINKNKEQKEFNIDGHPVRLRRLAPISIRPETAQRTTNSPNIFICPDNKIACGSSCALSTQDIAGTMGALLKFNNDNDLYLLSNNHVIGACNHAQNNAIITMPAHIDSVSISAVAVGTLSKIVPLVSANPYFVPPCKVDAAIGKVTSPERVTSWQGDLKTGFDTPARVRPLTSGMRVKKFGRTTGLTHGTVESEIVGEMPVPYKAKFFDATVYFKEVWLVAGENGKPFALAGDSGSLVVTEDSEAAVGVLFANDIRYGVVLPLQSVLNELGGAQIVSGYRIPNTSG